MNTNPQWSTVCEADISLHLQAENYDQFGERQAMPADVFLSTNAGEVDASQADPSPLPATISLSGGAEFHVGPNTHVRTTGGGIEVGKGSKMAVSQFAKVQAEGPQQE
jgi:hypothetical protein